jgi:hypothetical protein
LCNAVLIAGGMDNVPFGACCDHFTAHESWYEIYDKGTRNHCFRWELAFCHRKLINDLSPIHAVRGKQNLWILCWSREIFVSHVHIAWTSNSAQLCSMSICQYNH